MTLSDELLAVLNDPTHMWTHALKELSGDAQRLFLTLTLLPKPVSADVLQIAYTAQKIQRSESFLDSLRSLEDSFISIERRYGELRAVSFRNPSLQDFANLHLNEYSDWLDSLLGAPRYFDQIMNAFSLAMSSEVVIVNPATRSRKPGPPKYPSLKAWVARQAGELINTAVGLLGSGEAGLYRDRKKSRLGQLLEIIVLYEIPTDSAVLDELRKFTTTAMQPDGRESADVMLELLSEPAYRTLLDRFIAGSAADIMRTSILDKDDWKYAVLARLDKILKLDWQYSWESWGNDYIDYAKQLTVDLSQSDDYDALRVAINELGEINSMLDADLYDQIEILEQRQSSLPQDNDYDDTAEGDSSPKDVDDTAGLDRIFSSLL